MRNSSGFLARVVRCPVVVAGTRTACPAGGHRVTSGVVTRRRIVLPIILLAAFMIARDVRPSPSELSTPATIDEDMPLPTQSYVVEEAPRTIDELKQRIE